MSDRQTEALIVQLKENTTPEERAELYRRLGPQKTAELEQWHFWARDNQRMPQGTDWFLWMILAGRGFGKTRTAVENINQMVTGSTPMSAPPGAPSLMTIVADSPFDMRQYTIEGPSGFLNRGWPDRRPIYEPSKRQLVWPNGIRAMLFSAEDPETLRGASGEFFWWDELAKSRYAQAGWDNMLFGMREGNPRGIVTTTPRPKALIKELVADPTTVITKGSTYDNIRNLPQKFINNVLKKYEGTRLGRQEINAEILDDVMGALWERPWFDEKRIQERLGPDHFPRIVVAIDPSGTSGQTAAERAAAKDPSRMGSKERSNDIGIVVCACTQDQEQGFILEDLTANVSPNEWARISVEAYKRWNADHIVAERNFGGAMVKAVIRGYDAKVPFKEVTASRGKVARAEPVAALYEQGRISHMGQLDLLEDQMCQMTPDGFQGDGSPDRVDAAVWGLTDLMLKAPDTRIKRVSGPRIIHG